MLLMPIKRNPNSMILMPTQRGKRNPNSMILMPTGKRDFNLPRPNGLLTMGKRNPNNLLLPLFQKRGGDNNAKRETNLDEFFTSRGKKSFVLMPVS